MSRNTRTAVPIIATVACFLFVAGTANADTAHCKCKVATDHGGSVDHLDDYIYDFGVVATYDALFPQNKAHQDMCMTACSQAAHTWLSDKNKVCDGFTASAGANLVFYMTLGSLPWWDVGVTTASAVDFPKSCFGPPGYVDPAFYILSILYAPPGCTKSNTETCPAYSSVTYSTESTASTTTSTEKSFQKGVTVEASAGKDGVGSVKGSLGFSATSTKGSSLTISKTKTIELSNSGAVSNDGVDHDFDLFYVLVNPRVAWVPRFSSKHALQWSLGVRDAAAVIQKVQVSYLRCALAGVGPGPGGPYDYLKYGGASCEANPKLQMPGPMDASSAKGFLPGMKNEDYKQILAQDPFWNNPNILPPSPRYTQEPFDFPYDPPGGMNGDVCSTIVYTNLSNTATTTSSGTSQDVTASVAGHAADDTNYVQVTGTWTWTTSASTENTKSNSQTASVEIGCASSGYAGPFLLSTYYDNLYGTFLFATHDYGGHMPVVHGRVTDNVAISDVLRGVPVKLVVGSSTYQTFTDRAGSFAFYTPLPKGAAAKVVAGSTSQDVTIGLSPVLVTFTIPQPPMVNVSFKSRAFGAAGVQLQVTNAGALPMKNVTVKSITGIAASGATIVYNTPDVPFVIPGASALAPGATANFTLNFAATSGNVNAPFSFMIKVSADGLEQSTTSTTTIKVPAGGFVIGPPNPPPIN